MDLLFADPALQHVAESSVRLDETFGHDDGALVRQRLSELVAAQNLGIAARLPTLHVKEMTPHEGRFTVRIRSGFRLVFEIPEPSSVVDRGAVDQSRVEAVRIVAIEECDES